MRRGAQQPLVVRKNRVDLVAIDDQRTPIVADLGAGRARTASGTNVVKKSQMRRAVVRIDVTCATDKGSPGSSFGDRLMKCMTIGAIHHNAKNGTANGSAPGSRISASTATRVTTMFS